MRRRSACQHRRRHVAACSRAAKRRMLKSTRSTVALTTITNRITSSTSTTIPRSQPTPRPCSFTQPTRRRDILALLIIRINTQQRINNAQIVNIIINIIISITINRLCCARRRLRLLRCSPTQPVLLPLRQIQLRPLHSVLSVLRWLCPPRAQVCPLSRSCPPLSRMRFRRRPLRFR